ncbi:hypothetical protein DJ546_23315 [Enterobacter hormaechei]|nr:hypothetical protein DJ546_23315 [Enterobacter hormaechei]
MQRLHAYPDIRAMFRRLLIATVTGVLAALAVAVFRHSMYLLEWLFLSNECSAAKFFALKSKKNCTAEP